MKSGGILAAVARTAFSHIGSCVIVILYCMGGGLIFEHLEKVNEVTICYDSRKEYDAMQNSTLTKMIQIVEDMGPSKDMESQIDAILFAFRDNVIAINYDGTKCDEYGKDGGPTYSWSWAGGLMFSVTVVSTIGYGHISPKTVWGRLVCIAYALLGIPLMLLFLAKIGDALADVFRYVYARICCCGCLRTKNETKVIHIKQRNDQVGPLKIGDNPMVATAPIGEKQMDGKDCLALPYNKSKLLASAPPHHTELKPSEFESYTKCEEMKEASNKRSSTPACRPSSTTPHERSQCKTEVLKANDSRKPYPLDIKHGKTEVIKTDDTNPRANPLILDDNSDDEDDDLDADSKVTIPLTITMLVIALYIVLGSALFGLWEGWDMLQSAYFCFVTLSTIGFGDVVPGTDFHSSQRQSQLILGCIYVVFGMAILSMCFTLMQDEIVAKFTWIGQKLGIIDKDDD